MSKIMVYRYIQSIYSIEQSHLNCVIQIYHNSDEKDLNHLFNFVLIRIQGVKGNHKFYKTFTRYY